MEFGKALIECAAPDTALQSVVPLFLEYMEIPTHVCRTPSVKLYNALKEDNVTTESQTMPNVKHGQFATEQKKGSRIKM